MATVYNKSQPKKITVLKNGDPTYRHVVLLNRRTAQQYEQVLHDLSEMFKFAVRKLCTTEGKRVSHEFESDAFVSATFVNLYKFIINA